jgi:Predicted thioesterase
VSEQKKRLSRNDFVVFVPISTRWSDNDVYRHVNNVVYYSYFDTAVNQHLVEGGFSILKPAPLLGWWLKPDVSISLR